ncbi:hypothetical protein CC1G_08379 [Coprinopsis cinerea okayama7|uniref:Uncharacterized protein n=1 Tax=Coprinopsis cinerea (strain Okayama-7 / 130 / ATCC MYA-4618 / FGSC 9003) TaxID=240176 RepID=A8NAC3_COPC7|nr:hypothetical protein CC1G_08379 [Coprinopsis cinerea okayama7\|eukprot:XP_001831775.1 hypothetical protein CC1G_08379 [Coprinopsis cinerea okayama7\
MYALPDEISVTPEAGSLASDMVSLGADYSDMTSMPWPDRSALSLNYVLPAPPPRDDESPPVFGPRVPGGLADITNGQGARVDSVSAEDGSDEAGLVRKRGLEQSTASEGRGKRARRGNREAKSWVADMASSWKSRSGSSAWVRCVDSWEEFERDKVVESRLPNSKSRPAEVSRWVTSGRKMGVAPPIDDIDDFGKRWVAWWSSMQPKWRKIGVDGLPVPIGSSGPVQSLSTVRKPGPTGIAFVLETLLWWKDGSDTRLWEMAVDDMRSCLVPNETDR